MEDYQKRVVTEKSELDAKIEKLTQFITTETYFDLDLLERGRLARQLKAMKNYSFCLWERIILFDPKAEHFGLRVGDDGAD